MATKNNVTMPAPIDAPVTDIAALLPTMRGAMDGLAKAATAHELARVKCLAFADMVTATFGSLNVLLATSRNKDATAADKANHDALKSAYLTELWGADFMAWLASDDTGMRAPKRGQKVQPRSYWLQQKGAKWNKVGEGFIPKVLAFVEEAKPVDAGTPKTGQGKALDVACLDNVNAAVKRIAAAQKDGKGIPTHVDVAAFVALAKLAMDALEKGKGPQGRAAAAMKALVAAKIIVG